MRQLPTPAQWFVGTVVAIAAALLVVFVEAPAPERLPELAILFFLAITTSTLKLPLPTTKSRATMSASFVIDFTALLIVGPHQTLPIAAAGALSQSILGGPRRNPLHRTLFNIATFVITIETSGAVNAAFGGSLGKPADLALTVPILAAAITYFFVNTGLVAIAVSLSTSQSAIWVWRQNFLWSGPNYLIGAAAATGFALLVTHRLWSLVPLTAVPVYLTHRAYRAYAGRLAEEQRHRHVVESLNEGLAVIDGRGVVTMWNDALERILTCDRGRALGRPLLDVLPALARTELPQALRAALGKGEPQLLDQFSLGSGPQQRTLQVRVFPFVEGATIFWNDVTDRAEAERALKRSEERYALAASGSNDGLWDWDLVSGEIYVSQRWRTIVGLGEDDAVTTVTREWFGHVHDDDRASLHKALEDHIRGETEQFQHEHRIQMADGTCRWVLCRGAAVRNRAGRATRIAGSLTDVTDRAETQERLRAAAMQDTLTGLPNRRLFAELLRQTLQECHDSHGRRCAVLFLDVDRFKVVNDSLGHLVGDELLVTVADRLRTCLRPGDVLARLGGDEFTILLNRIQTANQACATAIRIQDAIQAPMSIGGRELFVSASIGIAVSTREYAGPEDFMRDADAAMYRAKARGKARHELFDAEMRAEDLERLNFENDLRRAIERGQLLLHYQPIVSLETGQWTGFEALVRWERDGRLVSPAHFIPLAEEIGMIEPIGTFVLQEACRQFAEWCQKFPERSLAAITVNVSPRQLLTSDFVPAVARARRKAHLAPGQLRLELTETSLMARPELVAEVLRELQEQGVNIYLDDFGTGYSSLSHLHKLRVDALKIDRSFVATLKRSGRPAIVESILALARSLDTLAIAEGVETPDQRMELLRLGCRHAQGYLFAPPLKPEVVEACLAGTIPMSSVSGYLRDVMTA